MKRLLALAMFFLGYANLATGEETNTAEPTNPTVEASRARQLVRQLADPRFRIRDAAAKELMTMGRAAKSALLDGMKNADAEVWNRCGQLLPEVMAADLKARVDAFLADSESKQTHDLPMMERYQRIVGKDANARKLFAEMVRSNADLLEACDLNPEQAGAKYVVRAQELQQHVYGPPGMARIANSNNVNLNKADLAVLFLIGADAEMSKGIPGHINPVANFLWQQEFQNALRQGEQAAPFRRLFFSWADNRRDLNSISQTLSVIQNVPAKSDEGFRKDGLEFAVKVMKMKDLQDWTRAQSLTCIGKIGGKEQLPALEELFNDKTPITNNIQLGNLTISTQVKDIALAMAIHVSGQSHKDYGFDALQSQPNLLWSYHFLGFTTEEKRTAAFKKYADWSAATKKK